MPCRPARPSCKNGLVRIGEPSTCYSSHTFIQTRPACHPNPYRMQIPNIPPDHSFCPRRSSPPVEKDFGMHERGSAALNWRRAQYTLCSAGGDLGRGDCVFGVNMMQAA